MIWSRLKSMKCPECNSKIQRNMMERNYYCIKNNCGFKIGHESFNEVVASLYRKKSDKEDSLDNLSDLNNL